MSGASGDGGETVMPSSPSAPIAILILILVLAAGVYGVIPSLSQASWRVDFYPKPDFQGVPTRRFFKTIDFNPGLKAPLPDFPAVNYSLRAETLLRIREKVDARFVLASDDGSRLFLNEKLIINLWWTHGIRYGSADVPLEPGTHRLRVEYYQGDGASYLRFIVRFGQGEFDSIPLSMLHPPEDSPNTSDEKR